MLIYRPYTCLVYLKIVSIYYPYPTPPYPKMMDAPFPNPSPLPHYSQTNIYIPAYIQRTSRTQIQESEQGLISRLLNLIIDYCLSTFLNLFKPLIPVYLSHYSSLQYILPELRTQTHVCCCRIYLVPWLYQCYGLRMVNPKIDVNRAFDCHTPYKCQFYSLTSFSKIEMSFQETLSHFSQDQLSVLQQFQRRSYQEAKTRDIDWF